MSEIIALFTNYSAFSLEARKQCKCSGSYPTPKIAVESVGKMDGDKFEQHITFSPYACSRCGEPYATALVPKAGALPSVLRA